MGLNNMKDGDVFFWSHKGEDKYGNNSGTAYWCMDQQCVYRNGKLMDTYNYTPYRNEDQMFDYGGLRSEFTKYVDPDKADLEYICNVDDLEPLGKYDDDRFDYEPDVIFDMSYHSGYKKLVCKIKGSKKSPVRQAEKIQFEIDTYRRTIQNMKRDIRQLVEKKESILGLDFVN